MATGATSASSSKSRPNASKRAQATTLNLPGVTAEFHRPELPGRKDIEGAVNGVREYLPSRTQLAYFSGLGLLGAFSVIEWPVVAAIGVGTVVAQKANSGT